MKAFTFNKYGPPKDVLILSDQPVPNPDQDQVLIKLKFTSINDYDWSMVTGKPKLYQLLFGLFKPKNQTPGMEFSGIVEKTGENVNEFKAGEAVYGDISEHGFGTFSEYFCVNKDSIRKKLETMNFVDASALPHASLLAYQAFRKAGIKQGDKILINGAGGGVGTLGLQMAKTFDCHVTGIDTGPKLVVMKELGFDEVIDYKKVNFTKTGMKYDLILDCKSNKNIFSYLSALAPHGTYVTVGGKIQNLMAIVSWSKIIALFSSKRLMVLALKANEKLDEIEDLYAKGLIKPIIDGPYSFDQIPGLLQYFGEGKHKGKIIISGP